MTEPAPPAGTPVVPEAAMRPTEAVYLAAALAFHGLEDTPNGRSYCVPTLANYGFTSAVDAVWAAAASLMQEETAELRRKFDYESVSLNYHRSVIANHAGQIAAVRRLAEKALDVDYPAQVLAELLELTAEPDEDDA